MKVPLPALTIPLAGVMALVAQFWIGLRMVPAALLSDPRVRWEPAAGFMTVKVGTAWWYGALRP